MGLIRLAIERPIAVVAAVLMILIFGMLALQRIPIQLSPDFRKTVITVTTYWAGGSPIEVEREVINRQEEVLKGVQGVTKLESRSQDGRGTLTTLNPNHYRSPPSLPPPPPAVLPGNGRRILCGGRGGRDPGGSRGRF